MSIIFTGGGTGGHVVPNLAILEELTKGIPVAYIGSAQGPEKALVEAEGYPFYSIMSGKWRRYVDWRNLRDPFYVVIGVVQAMILLRKLQAKLVFSKGGFVALPVVFAAWLLRIPVWMHESDQSPGLTSRLSMPLASRIWFKQGVPVRKAISLGSLEGFQEKFAFRKTKPILVFLGGSMGAEEINQWFMAHREEIEKEYQWIHIFGHGKGEFFQSEHGIALPYVKEGLEHIYASAAIIVTRAGATSLAELELCHKRLILWPLGLHQSRGDQLENAKTWMQKNPFWELFQGEEHLMNQIRSSLAKPLPEKKKNKAFLAQEIACALEQTQKPVLWIPAWFFDKENTGIGYFTKQIIEALEQAESPYQLRLIRPRLRLGRRAFESLSSLVLLWKARRDAVYFLYPQLLAPMWRLLRSKKCATFLQMHDWIDFDSALRSSFKKKIFYKYLAWSYGAVTSVAFVSHTVKKEWKSGSQAWKAWFAWSHTPMAYVPNRLDAQWASALAMSASEKWSQKNKKIVYFAGYDKRKSVPEMVETFLKIKKMWQKNNPSESLELHLFGAPHFDSSAYDNPKAFQDPSVVFRGKLDQASLQKEVEGAFAMLHFSESEGFNLPLLQSMKLGVPCLVRDLPVHREVAGAGALFFVDTQDALTKFLAWQDGALYEKMSADAKEKAKAFESLEPLWQFLSQPPSV